MPNRIFSSDNFDQVRCMALISKPANLLYMIISASLLAKNEPKVMTSTIFPFVYAVMGLFELLSIAMWMRFLCYRETSASRSMLPIIFFVDIVYNIFLTILSIMMPLAKMLRYSITSDLFNEIISVAFLLLSLYYHKVSYNYYYDGLSTDKRQKIDYANRPRVKKVKRAG